MPSQTLACICAGSATALRWAPHPILTVKRPQAKSWDLTQAQASCLGLVQDEGHVRPGPMLGEPWTQGHGVLKSVPAS